MKFKNKILSIFLAAFIAAFSFTFNTNALTIDKQYINKNRGYRTLYPQGIVIHDTCAPGGTAQNNHDYFNHVYVGSSAHFFADWKGIIQCIPTNEQAWHAGPYANHRFLSIEMCNPKGYNQAQFNIVYKNTVELAANLCKKYGWSSKNIISHSYVSHTWHQTDHEDPIAFLHKYGKSWNTLISDIQKAINGQSIISNQPKKNNSNVNISKGTKVKVIGNKYATGQTIPSWVKQNNYTVQKVTSNKALIKEIESWVYIKDLKVIEGIKNNCSWINLDGKVGVVTAKNGLNVRQGKNTNSRVLGVIPYGSKVRLYKKEGDWIHIYYPKSGGYVYSKYIKF